LRSAFEWIDEQRSTLLGFNPFAIIWNVSMWRKFFGFCVLASLCAWAFFGFDSTWSQILPFVDNFIPLLRGEVSFSTLIAESRKYYGVGNHWSAPVIYGSAFIALSQYFERIGIKRSENFCLTTSLSLMNIGVFEWLWNTCYAVFQRQPWTITWRWKQSTNLFSFTAFIILGLLSLLYLYAGGYRPNTGRRSLLFLALTALCWIIWILYPLPVKQLTVQTAAGVWTSSRLFPQTYYAVDVSPGDGVAIGEPFWVQNDMVHALNTLTKVMTTLTVLNLCFVTSRGFKYQHDKFYDDNVPMHGGVRMYVTA